MITHNSSNPVVPTKAKVLVLEIGEKKSNQSRKNMFKSHKLRKTIPIESKQTKAVSFLQNFQLKELLSSGAFEGTISSSKNHSQHQSAYLVYKQNQREKSLRNNNKIRSLKTKYQTSSLPTKILSSEPSRTRRKMSLVLLGETLSEEPEESPISNHGKRVYLKTSQGKRRAIDPQTYLSRIKDRILNLQQYEAVNFPLAYGVYETNFNTLPINVIPPRPSTIKTRRSNFMKKELLRANLEDIDHCRPWTSNKSEIIDQE